MKVGPRWLILIAAIITLVFLRLGFWQLSRLGERQELNAELASRAVDSAVAISQLPTDTANAHYRRVSVQGAYDYANEIVLTLRSRDGSPGIKKRPKEPPSPQPPIPVQAPGPSLSFPWPLQARPTVRVGGAAA